MTKKFICDIFTPKEADVIVFGAPLGEGSKHTLSFLREVSRLVEPFDIEKKINLLEGVKIADIGDLKLENYDEITEQTKKIVDNKKIPLVLGGDHLLTFYSVKALPKNITIVVFDAHCDLKDMYLDSKSNKATWLRRLYESGNSKIAIVGVRSCDEDELNFMKENNILYFTSNQIKKGIIKVKEQLSEFIDNSPIYLSIDIDVFDPSIAPAVEYPEPNGLLFSEFLDLMEVFKKLIGLDLVEIKSFENNRITEFLGIKVIFEILSSIKDSFI